MCTIGDLPTSQSDELLAAVRVGDAAPNGEKITLTATVKATKATSVKAKATIDVVVSSSSSSSSSTSADSSVGDGIPGSYVPELNGGLTTASGLNPSGLFPTVTPSASAPTAKSKKKGRNVDAATVSSTLPLDSRLIGGQLAGLAVLASAIAIAVARLSLRTQRPVEGRNDRQQT
jgi:hypothetical protein